MRSPLPLFVLAIVSLAHQANSAASAGAASPHDGQHLIVLHPGNWTGPDGRSLNLVKDRGAMFDGSAAPLSNAIEADVKVLHKGRYTLWFRIARGKATGASLEATLTLGDKKVHSAAFGDGRGSETKGGPIGFESYAKRAKQASPLKDVDINPNGKGKPMGGADDILGELNNSGKSWDQPMRLEEPLDPKPFYWWHAGTVELTPGTHRLRIQPPANTKGETPLLDLAFLTTFEKLTYPYAGDVNAPASSYIRFRIDRLPKEGVNISAGLRTHSDPFSTPQVWCNPAGLDSLKAAAHERIGFTRWYRLQDILNAPAFGAAQAHLHLKVTPVGRADVPPGGATQFAVFPHDDHVLREFDWSEPESLNISMVMDFQNRLHLLRTLRDHAREHYEMALAATDEKLYPLTRGDLHFGNSWGAATGDCAGYMNQTLRLIGINNVGAGQDPVKYREIYGWSSSAGHYWPPSYMPYDEAVSRKKYDDFYVDYFTKRKDLYPEVTTFQIADEPGEILRSEMTAPLWRYLKDDRGDKWADLPGNSDLNTRRCDLHDCVLEGKIEKHGRMIGFRVGIDNADAPKNYAYWHIGVVSVNRENNLAAGKVGSKEAPVILTRPGALVAAAPTQFKIVYQGSSAALYLSGKLIHQHTNLPAKGGIGFTGGAKALRELRLRPIRKEERLAITLPDGPAPKTDDLLDDLEAKKEPDWAKQKPLEKAVAEDWVVAGGVPEAHAAFRVWAQAQGLQPDLFGQKSWNDVRLLTVAELVRNPEEARLYYWSRNFSGYLTARMFGLAAESIQRYAANPNMRGFVALSGHSLYFPSALPLDMFRLAAEPAVQPGISDWMSLGSWFWDSHQAVAFSVAPYNAGARRYGQEPLNYPMMHCVGPTTFRAYTMLANQVRNVSYFNYGPSYAVTEGFWSDDPGAYYAVHRTANRAALVDDVLASSRMRPSRVAMLYSMANEYWNPQSSFADKRAAFLALSHEYYQPELVTEEQVESGALKHYDALYVLDPRVRTATQGKIKDWLQTGGLLWTCADALTSNEYNEPHDFLAKSAGLTRTFKDGKLDKIPTIAAVKGEAEFRSHTVAVAGKPTSIEATKARVRARYDDGTPAWLEMEFGKGRIVYIGHRAGLTYTSKKVRPAGNHTIWADTSRDLLTKPLHEAKVDRELVLSEPVMMASPLSSADGTVVMLYNMQPTRRTKLEIGLKEPAKPHSVETFNGARLEALPFEYRDGRVWFTLPELVQEQMVLVRRNPAPADPRLADLRQRTEKQLASSDATTLAAGAWVAGFYPIWMVNDKLVTLLAHTNWEVRRAAAEALGRRGEPSTANAILASFRKETDAHVLGDDLIALARLGHAEAPTLCRELLHHKQGWVRGMAVRAAGIWKANPEQAKDLASAAIAAGLADLDWRVKQPAIDLLGRTDATRTVEGALTAPPGELATWADAISKNNAVFSEYQRQAIKKNDALLFAVAARRADASLVAALTERLDRLSTADQAAFVRAVLTQRNPALTRTLFERRDKLPPVVAGYLTLLLENTFGARLGNNLSDWEVWLRQ